MRGGRKEGDLEVRRQEQVGWRGGDLDSIGSGAAETLVRVPQPRSCQQTRLVWVDCGFLCWWIAVWLAYEEVPLAQSFNLHPGPLSEALTKMGTKHARPPVLPST